ncbi:MAG TPA: efflux RND transporter periplasmic adaptor subunit [Hyphomicrobiaceae bacterium]|nr:efflux RND transporter periplasmic adaptor subunit [Hyphomicrobiaceae bacterium]
MRRSLVASLAMALLLGGFAGYRYNDQFRGWIDSHLEKKTDKPRKGRQRPPAPVRVTAVRERDVPIVLEGVGNVQAMSTVEIKSRIDGQLTEAAIKDGQLVEKGELLFKLDARPLKAQLLQAEANLNRDKANLEKARTDMARATNLTEKGIAPKTKLEDAQSSFAALAAAIHASEATVELARLNLEYATIRAPISGRVGSVLLAPGNMVKANDTRAILVITQTHPVNVTFALPEQYIGELRTRMAGGAPLEISATIQGEDKPTAHGKLFFINNVVDMATGTIQVMGRFENADDRLVPGQFVKARVTITTLPSAVVTPSKSVQINQKGHYVWVMKPEKIVELRFIEIGPLIGSDTVITKGLAKDEIVVTDGQLRLFPKAKVNPIEPGKKRGKSKEQS